MVPVLICRMLLLMLPLGPAEAPPHPQARWSAS